MTALAPTIVLFIKLVNVQVGFPLPVGDLEFNCEVSSCHGVEVPDFEVKIRLCLEIAEAYQEHQADEDAQTCDYESSLLLKSHRRVFLSAEILKIDARAWVGVISSRAWVNGRVAGVCVRTINVMEQVQRTTRLIQAGFVKIGFKQGLLQVRLTFSDCFFVLWVSTIRIEPLLFVSSFVRFRCVWYKTGVDKLAHLARGARQSAICFQVGVLRDALAARETHVSKR